jgi:hypothetical protein
LLPRHHQDVRPPPPRKLNKTAEIVAAASAGKLPSQKQINVALRKILSANLLKTNAAAISGYGPLSARGQQVVRDINEILDAALEFGGTKNCECFIVQGTLH